MDAKTKELARAYDELPLWSASFGLMLLEFVDLRATAVLDVGCGTGFPALELAQRLGSAAHVTGIDTWEEALERARFKAQAWGIGNATFTQANASSLPFEDAKFDLVVSNLGINNFEQRDAALRECHRTLKRGGKVALTTNLMGHMQEFYEVFERTLRDADEVAAIEALREHVAHRGTLGSVRTQLEEAGFTLSRTESRSMAMRFRNGRALFAHHFIQLGFCEQWRSVARAEKRSEIFARLETELDRIAAKHGALELTIPMAYLEAVR